MRPVDAVKAMVSPEGRRDPYPFYEQIRAHGNLVRIKDDTLVAVGYAECDRILRQTRMLVPDAASFDRSYPDWRAHSSLRGYTSSVLYRNVPDHRRMRSLMNTAFTPRRVADLQGPVETMVDRLLDRMAGLGAAGAPVDFVPEFASRLPIAVISALLGVSEDDHVWFREVAADLTLALEGFTQKTLLSKADTAMDELTEYFRKLIDHRRSYPVDDLLSALSQIHHRDGEVLTEDELVGNLMLLLTAGFETTTFMLGYALLIALADPELAERLRTEPELATGFAEEVLRFEPPVQGTTRWAGTDLEIGGMEIPAGAKVVVVLAAGNRDPERFAEPDRFDPGRANIQPLTFGAGTHMCLGAPLARLESQIAMPMLLRRFPNLAVAGAPVPRDTWVGRGLDHLPITLG